MMISLPTKWVKENSLGKGSEVELTERDNLLVISKDPEKIKREVTINLTTPIRTAVRTLITNAYRTGYDKVTVNFKEKHIYNFIKELVDEQLLGYEIIKKEGNSCVIENIASLTEEQFDNIFAKLWMNIEETFEYVEQYLRGEKPEFEKTQNKTKEFDNLCRRIIFKENLPNSELNIDFHSDLVHAQRELYLLLTYLENHKIKNPKTELEVLFEAKKSFGMLKKAYYEKDIVLVEQLIQFQQEHYKIFYKDLEKANPIVIHHLMNALRGFYLGASPLAGMLMN